MDVYAFGILMYELFNSDMSMMRILSKAQNVSETNKLIHEYVASMLNGFREELPLKWPQKLKVTVFHMYLIISILNRIWLVIVGMGDLTNDHRWMKLWFD